MNRQVPNPLVILAVAVLLPGVGQVLNQQPRRGLVFDFYTVLLGAITYLVAPPQASMIGQVAGGVFVYAIGVLDAYQGAARRRRPATTEAFANSAGASTGVAEGIPPDHPTRRKAHP